MQRGIVVHFSQGCQSEGDRQYSSLAQIPLKPLESMRVYQAPGSAVCRTGDGPWFGANQGEEDNYSEGARRPRSHSATETLCLCMENSALISRLYWRHTLPVSNLCCWFFLHSCLSPTQSCCFWCSCSLQWWLDRVAVVTPEREALLLLVILCICVVCLCMCVSGL